MCHKLGNYWSIHYKLIFELCPWDYGQMHSAADQS